MHIITTSTPDEFKKLVKECLQELLSHQQSQSQGYDKPLTIDQAAEYLGVPKATLYQLTRQRTIPFTKVGRRLAFLPSELDHWLRQTRRKTRLEIESPSPTQV